MSVQFEDCELELYMNQSSHDSYDTDYFTGNSTSRRLNDNKNKRNIQIRSTRANELRKESSKNKQAKIEKKYANKKPTQSVRKHTPSPNNSKNTMVQIKYETENIPLKMGSVQSINSNLKKSSISTTNRINDKVEQLLMWGEAKDKRVEKKRKDEDREMQLSRSRRRISAKKIEENMERLYDEAFILESKKRKVAIEASDFPFRPQINARSIELAKIKREKMIVKIREDNMRITSRSTSSVNRNQSSSPDEVPIKQQKPKKKKVEMGSKSLMSEVKVEDSLNRYSLMEIKPQMSSQRISQEDSIINGSSIVDYGDYYDYHDAVEGLVECPTEIWNHDSRSDQEMKIEGADDSEPKASEIEDEVDLEYEMTIKKMIQMQYDKEISLGESLQLDMSNNQGYKKNLKINTNDVPLPSPTIPVILGKSFMNESGYFRKQVVEDSTKEFDSLERKYEKKKNLIDARPQKAMENPILKINQPSKLSTSHHTRNSSVLSDKSRSIEHKKRDMVQEYTPDVHRRFNQPQNDDSSENITLFHNVEEVEDDEREVLAEIKLNRERKPINRRMEVVKVLTPDKIRIENIYIEENGKGKQKKLIDLMRKLCKDVDHTIINQR